VGRGAESAARGVCGIGDAMVTTAELAWIAGILEGEGHFGFYAKTCNPRIVLAMCDRDIVERVAAFWGKNVRAKKVKARGDGRAFTPQWTTSISGPEAVGWMLTLFRFMGYRRRGRMAANVAAWRRGPVPYGKRTHCPKGHAYDGHNVILSLKKRTSPVVARHCRACSYAATRDWARRHPERVTELSRRWAIANPDKRRAAQQRYDAKRRGSDPGQLVFA
jgi:hypothetical protein